MNDGVAIVLKRMETHPEEFHGDKNKWMFIYKDFFRDAMTETEKGAIYDRLKEIRKEEFTQRVVETITREEIGDSDGWAEEQMSRFAPEPRKKMVMLKSHQLNAINALMKQGISREVAMETLGYK